MKKRKAASNRIDMTSKIYNSWRIIEIDTENCKGKIVYWKAECLACNKNYSVHGPNVRLGLSKRCLECGNKQGHDKQKGTVRTKRTSQETAHYYLYLDLRKRANKRGFEWNISENEVKNLILSSCEYCGLEPGSICNPLKWHGLSQRSQENSQITRNGIDRVNPDKGYFTDNVVPCCKTCNTMKMALGLEAFLEHVHRIVEHQKSKIKS